MLSLCVKGSCVSGLTYAITALGVGVGYVIGGQFLSLWVDIGRTDTSV